MTEWHSPHKERYRTPGAVLLMVLFLCGGPLWALDGNGTSGTLDYKLIPVAHISPDRGRDFLTRLHLGTASRLPGTEALLVTAGPEELRKASAVLNIVDTRTEFDIKELGPASAARTIPSNEQIAQALGGISIGTFANPPRDKTKMRAIIDVHNGAVVAIAPASQMADIQTAVEFGPEVLKQRKAAAGPVDSARITATIQASAIADPSVNTSAESERTRAAQAIADPKKFTLPKDMQQKVEEMRRQAAALRASGPATPVAQPNVQPAPAPVAEPPQVNSNLSLGQANEEPVTPAQPAEPLQATGTPQGQPEEPKPEEPVEPAADPTSAIRPGEIVPPGPNQVTPPPVVPAPVAQMQTSNEETAEKLPLSLYRPSEIPNGEQPVNLILPEKLQVIQLLDLMGKYLNLSFAYDPAKVTGEVTLKLNGDLRGAMKVKDLYLLLESVLQFKDLVMTRHKGSRIVKIVPKSEFLNLEPVMVGPETPPVEVGDVVVSRVFELKHIETNSAQSLLEGMGLAVGVTPADKKTLIVTAYAARMERIEHLLQLIDRPGEPRVFRDRPLKFTMAKALAEKVKALAEQMESVTVIVAEPEVTPTVTRQPNESDAAYRTRLNQIRAVQAAAARSRAAVTGQQPEMAKGGVYLDADERTNRILMVGVKDQLDVVETLVDSLDVEQKDLRTLTLYRIRHVDAEEVARKLQELKIISTLPETSMSSYSSRITGAGRYPYASQVPGQPRPPTPQTPEPQVPPGTELTKEGLVEEPQVVVVESTNSLLVNATVEQHKKIESIITHVDSKMLDEEIPYKIYQLKNSSPKHLAELLESLIQETVEQQKEGGKIEKTVVSRDETIKIVADPNTYSLIVYGNKTNQEWISSLIEKLDKRRPQVLIDCTLVEVTKSDAFNYDLQLTRNWNNGPGAGSPATNDPNAFGKFVSSIGGTLTAFYGDKEIQALLSTMQSKNYGRVLAKPKLLVNDNEKGIIETKDTTYVEVSSSVPLATATAGPQTNLVTTSVNFNPYEAGIMLDITPHISEGNLLRLDVQLTRSDFLKTPPVGAGRQQPPPNTRSNTVDTAVTLPNGSTVILGGLMKMNQNKGGSKVPILGDIPLIGGLFRTISNEDTQSKLYVFVKAEIIRPAEMAEGMEDLKNLSEKNRMAFEKHELEFQRYQDWPGIKPKPVDPPKVLDAQ